MSRSLAALIVATLAAAGPAAAATRVACVGDSLTFGYGTTAGSSYPDVLGRLLGADWTVGNFGANGKTMIKMPSADTPADSYWRTAAFTASKSFAPDVVVIMLGTNDSKTANWRNGDNTFAADYRAMIAEYAALPRRPRIFAVLPPPALSSAFTISGPVIAQQIIPIIRVVARDTGIALIDAFAAFAPDAKPYLNVDGVHPNDAGARLIAQTVLAAVQVGAADAGLAADGRPPAPDAAPDARVLPAERPLADGPTIGDDGPVAADARSPAEPPTTVGAPSGGCRCAVGRRAGGGPPFLVVAGLAIARCRRRRRCSSPRR